MIVEYLNKGNTYVIVVVIAGLELKNICKLGNNGGILCKLEIVQDKLKFTRKP